MKIELSEGCTAFWMSIDGHNLNHVGDFNEFEELVNTAFDKIINNLAVDSKLDFIKEYIQHNGRVTYESDEPCDSCGDYVTQFMIEI